MTPWKTWRHMREAESRGDQIATQEDLARVLRDVAKMAILSQLVLLVIFAGTAWIAWNQNAQRDAERDRSFSLICSVNQGNASDVSEFAGSVVRLFPPTAEGPIGDVRKTAARVRDTQHDFATAICDSRDDLERLIALREATHKEKP